MIRWGDLADIADEQIYAFKDCGLSQTYVGGEGDGDNPIAMIIGEAPGAQEEIRRRPFVGPAGIVLRDLMMSVGLCAKRGNGSWWESHSEIKENCWLTNTVKFRPPRNRTPTAKEINMARPFLRREWQAIGKPDLIIPVGAPALRAVMGRQMSILKMAGQMITHQRSYGPKPRLFYIWPMIHPSFGLRNEQVIPLLEKDWAKLERWLNDFYLRSK